VSYWVYSNVCSIFERNNWTTLIRFTKDLYLHRDNAVKHFADWIEWDHSHLVYRVGLVN